MLQKELDVLSERHSQKCLENSQLYQELQDEREALMQCQKENRGLHEKQVQGRRRRRRVWDFTSIVLSRVKILTVTFSFCALRPHRGRRRRSLSASSCQTGNSLATPLK